ncbi:hypothetical protein DAPPUDRAFT_319240 [Daphnia pulex]|uniref:Uncharacterized protein n=1 Tax=Daphnia pulex TaxID=6669 RepID=E9GL42_DAPPU|nr:hypothetical protein DAPPUDRAFT_319240 [Daphnia pulex]|eukprot:EFX79860.1 hypothetical protein DAPPUDRAFT_319240 [Daphnia pulex]
MEPGKSEDVTDVTINVDKEDTIIFKPTGTKTTTYTGKITISVQRATQVKKEFASFRNDLLAQLVGECINRSLLGMLLWLVMFGIANMHDHHRIHLSSRMSSGTFHTNLPDYCWRLQSDFGLCALPHLAKVRTVREQTVNKNSLFMNNVHEHGVYIFLPIAALSA